MPTSPPIIGAIPTPPTTSDASTFDARADAFVASFPTLQTDVNAATANVYANALEAEADAIAADASAAAAHASNLAAAASATAAATSAGATAWVSGATYAVGAVAWSPSTRLTYRRTVAGAGTTDPSADPSNWALAAVGQPQLIVSTATANSVAVNSHIVLTNAAASTATLPGTPQAGDTVWVTVGNARTDNLIARNGQKIMDLAEDMTLNLSGATVQLRFVNSTLGWRLI